MAKDCPSKKDKGNAKVKKEATSNVATERSEYDEVYINTMEFESDVAGKRTRPQQSRHTTHLKALCSLMEKKQKSCLIQER